MASSLMGKISQFARSGQGRRLAERAQGVARDPATRQKITDARQKLAARRRGSAPDGETDRPSSLPPRP
ncbi:MAG: hypothetical protein H0U24_04475 [Thermoleophilaceae bacterium]|nr:hypothetical protein [Thermoleophilaceae bacterium]